MESPIKKMHLAAAGVNFVAMVQLTGRNDLTVWLTAAVIFHALAIPFSLVVGFGPSVKPEHIPANKPDEPARPNFYHAYLFVWALALVFTWGAVASIFGHFGMWPLGLFVSSTLLCLVMYKKIPAEYYK